MELSTDSRGTYQRDCGWKEVRPGEYRQHRFYLGRDRAQATVRWLTLDKVWDAVCALWRKEQGTPRPLWDETNLSIAMGVARGQDVIELTTPAWAVQGFPDPRERAEVLISCLRDWQEHFPFLTLRLADARAQEQGEAWLREVASNCQATARKLLRRDSRQTLHQALDAYARYAGEKYRGTLWGTTLANEIGHVRRELPEDVPLSSVDVGFIERWIDHWRRRPVGKRGRPVSAKYARNIIKRIRHFLRWLHRAQGFDWQTPPDLEFAPVKIDHTPAELAGRLSGEQVETYSLEELATLYQYATPVERVYLLLALNCGFSKAEIGHLQLAEIHIGQPHPKYEVVGSWVRRLRHKTTVYGEWRLWPETVQAVEYARSIRPESEHGELILSKTGKPLWAHTSGGNACTAVSNAWDRLTRRVRKDRPDFPARSFGKVKKTADSWIREQFGGEVASLFVAHGEVVPDKLLDAYSNKPFLRLHEALGRLREHLAPMFARVPDPFCHGKGEKHPSVSLGTVDAIREMFRQGHSTYKIGEALQVGETTARRYTTGLQLEQVPPATARRIRELRAQGYKVAKIAEVVRLGQLAVRKVLRSGHEEAQDD
jgi:hypothetical protein